MFKLILFSTFLVYASSIADNDNAQEVNKPKAKQNFAAVCKANINVNDHLSELQRKLLQFGQFPMKSRKSKVTKQEKKEQLFNFLTSMSNEERQVLVKQICMSKKWLPGNEPKRANETDFEYVAQNTFKYSEHCVKRLVETEFSQLEMSKQFKDMVLALLDKPAAYDARQLHRALTAPVINAETIMEITLFRNNYQLALIGRTYDIMLEMGIFGKVPTNFMGRLFAGSKRKNLGALKWMLKNVKDKRVKFTNEKGILVWKICGNYCAKVFEWLSERLKLIGLQERLGLEEERTRKNVDGIITDVEKTYEIFIEKLGFVFSHFPADDIITLVTQSGDFGMLARNHQLIPTELNPYTKEARIARLYGRVQNQEQLRQEHSDYQMQLDLLRRLWQMLGVYDFVQRDKGHLNERKNEDVARRIRASIDQKEYEELTRLLVSHSEVDLLNVAYHFQSLRQFDFEQRVKKMKPFLTGTPVSYTKAVEKLLYNPAELRRKLDMNILLEVKQNQQKGIDTVSLKNGGSLLKNFDKLRPEDFKMWREQDLCINDPNNFSNLPPPKTYQAYPYVNEQQKQEILFYNEQRKQYTENANNANACPWCEQPVPAAKKTGRTRIFPFFSKTGSDKANKAKSGIYGFDTEGEYETGTFVGKEMKQKSQKMAPISGVQMNPTGFCTGYRCVHSTQYKDDSTGNTMFKPDGVAKKQTEFEMKPFVKTENVQTIKVVVDDPKSFVSRPNSENQAFPINPPYSSQPKNNDISPIPNQPQTANPIENAQYNVPNVVNIEHEFQQQLTSQKENYEPNFAVSQNPDELSAFDLIMRYIFQYNKYSTLEMAEIQYTPVAVGPECKEFVALFLKPSTSDDKLMKHAMKENCRPGVFHAYRAIYLDVCRSCETGTQKWMDLLEQWQLTSYHRNFMQNPAKFVIEECPKLLKAYKKMEYVQKLSQYDQVLRYIQHYGSTFWTYSDALEVAEKQCAIPNTVIPECRPFIESFVDGNVSDTQLTIDPKKDECRYAVYYVYRDVYLGVCENSDTDYEIWKESLKQWPPSYYKVVPNHQDYVTKACPKLMTAFKQGRIVCSHEMKQTT